MISIESVTRTPDELRAFAQNHFDWLVRCLGDGDHDSWMPHLAVSVLDPASGGQMTVMHALAAPFNTAEEKQGALRGIGRRLYAEKQVPVMAVLSSEAWLSRNPAFSAANSSRPEFDPDRQETVICMAATFTGHHLFRSVPISRRGPAITIVPGQAGEWTTTGRSPLLGQFWYGFAMAFPPFAASGS